MNQDLTKVEKAVLALLAQFAFDERVSWKGCDFDVMESLFDRGLIGDPRSKNKSVVLTEEGLTLGKELAAKLFSA